MHTPVLVDFCAEFLLVMSNMVHTLANHSLFNSSLVDGPVGCSFLFFCFFFQTANQNPVLFVVGQVFQH